MRTETEGLQINNYVSINGIIKKIHTITPTGIWVSESANDFIMYDEIDYVQVTRELLTKMNFINNYSDEFKLENENDETPTFVITFMNGKFYYSAGEGVMLSRIMQYLHELQNLYLLITGEKLIIKF